MAQLLPQAARLALRRALVAAQESRDAATTTTAPLFGAIAARLMSTATATKPADTSTSTSELKQALKAKIPAEQVRAPLSRD